MAIYVPQPFTFPPPLPDWHMSIEGAPISRIRTLSKTELECNHEILANWCQIYLLIARQSTDGSSVSDASSVIVSFLRNLDEGRVLVGEDGKGIAQVFARVIRSHKELVVEHLVAAPWNNATCKHVLKQKGLELFWSDPVAKSFVDGLAKGAKTTGDELRNPKTGSGAIMMFAVCHFANACKIPKLLVIPNRQSIPFYDKIGMTSIPGDRAYYFIICKETLADVDKRIGKYILNVAQ